MELPHRWSASLRSGWGDYRGLYLKSKGLIVVHLSGAEFLRLSTLYWYMQHGCIRSIFISKSYVINCNIADRKQRSENYQYSPDPTNAS